MRPEDISINPNPVLPGTWTMHVEIKGYQFTGYFGDFPGFLAAVTDCAKFFAVKAGKMPAGKADATRPIQ